MTLARYIPRDQLPTTQSQSGNFALPGVRLLGFDGADAETDAFELGSVDEGRGASLFGATGFAAAAEDLVEGCLGGRRCREGIASGLW